MINNTEKVRDKLIKERNLLKSNLQNAVNKGDVAIYSEAWYEMQGQIDSVSERIVEANNNIYEFRNNIRDIEWQNFDYLHESVSQVVKESNFLLDLFDNKKRFDKKGNILDIGQTAMALHGTNHNVYMEQSQSYARELEKINKDIANDPYNKDLIARRNELLSLQQESIINAENEKQAIIDLIEEGYNLKLESMQELIEKYKEALDSEKD